MKNPIPALVSRYGRLAAVIAACICPLHAADVFTDNFDRADVNTGTTNGSTAIGNGWTFHSDTNDNVRGGARIDLNTLQIGQPSASGYAGPGGSDRSWVWRDASTFAAPYSTTLGSNPETVVWTFNMRTGQPNPTPVSISGGGTVVAVLATAEPGTGDWQFGGTATGYFVTYNAASTVDPIKLVRMSNGVRNEVNHVNLVTATVPPFSDLSSQYLSVRVTYDPASNIWRLHARDDGGSFQDPRVGDLTFLGSATDNTYTATPLPYMGFLGNSNNGVNGGNDDLRFDNFGLALQDQVEAPVFSSATGTYSGLQDITISTAPAAAEIRYTIDGSEPTPTTGTIYTGPVAIGPATTTLKAIAYRAGLTDSAVTTATYDFQTGAPVFTPVEGSYADTQNVTITSATAGATIHYTTDGVTEPSPTTGTVYTGPIAISADTNLKAIAFIAGFADSPVTIGDYFIKAGLPSFNPVEGTYPDDINVTITTATPGATIHYTTDGNDPTSTTGTVYTGPVAISADTTLKAIAFKAGIPDSDVFVADYFFQSALPVFSPVGGTYANTQNVTITSATSGAEIRYTTNGDEPTSTSGTIYAGPVEIAASATIKAIAYKAGTADSDVASADYVIKTGNPVFSPVAGTYASQQDVTITTVTTGADIRYTTDGSEPTPSTGMVYSGPVAIASTSTLKAIAYKAGIVDSDVITGVFTIDGNFALVFEDTFSDGDRTNGADPLDGQWWVHTNSTASTLGAASGALVISRTTTNGNGFNPGAVTTFPAQVLAVGQTIELSFDATVAGGTAGANAFRFGIYNSGGNNLSSDLVGNPPGVGNTFQNDVGYSVWVPQHATGTGTLRHRIPNTDNNILQIGTNANQTIAGSGTITTATSPGTLFSGGIAITRVGTNSYDLTAKFAGNTWYVSNYSPSNTTTTFDSFSFFSIMNQANMGLTLDNVRVSVTTPNSANSLVAWRTLQGLPADGSQDNATPANDGVPNLIKYALNLAPNAGDISLPNNRALANPDGTTVADLTGLPVLRLNGTPAAVLTYIRRKSSSVPGITYSVQWSDGLTAWAPNGSATEATLSLDATWERVTLSDSFNTSSKPKRFARLSVTAP